MPLLNKKHFVRNDPPPNLEDDEEVFYSELTNEIFRDYGDFCERIFLCNSLVWSCGYTGRSNLTYQEAVNSEVVAKKMLNDFPLKLRIPVLYLTTLTERSSLIEFAEDVFAFARDRYFIGEDVEVCFSNDNWCDCRIIQVQYPTQKRLQEYNQQNQTKTGGERDYWPPAALYSYEVQVSDGPTYFVKADQVRRRKGVYSREKNRLYIKQFVERQNGIWKLKKNVYHKYGIDRVKFDMIFSGPAMASLAPPKKKEKKKEWKAKEMKKIIKQAKKEKSQGSIEKYFVKKGGGKQVNNGEGDSGGNSNSKKTTPRKVPETPQKTLVQKLKNKYKMNTKNGKLLKNAVGNKNELKERKKKEKNIRKSLTKKELQRLAFECKDKDVKEKFVFLKEKKLTKEDKEQVLNMLKEFTRFREDLECSYVKEIPAPLPIQMRIPNDLFGDFLQILEFFHSFSNVINVRDFFSSGISFDLLERALVETEVAGPLSDVIHVLLVTLFDLQDQEEDVDDKLRWDNVDQKDSKPDAVFNFKLALAAAAYSQHYQGQPLNKLPIDSVTLTEILRLHIISSGRRLTDDSDQSRGCPALNMEDPCSALCLTHPQLLSALSEKSVFELPIEDKVLIITSLMNQILSFASIKESIEEELENLKIARVDLRTKRAAELRLHKEAKKQLKEQKTAAGEDASKDKVNKEKDDKNDEDGDAQQARNTRFKLDKDLVLKARELQELELRVQCLPLGMDRAFRRYWVFYSTPGLYVEDNEPFPGTCLPKDSIPQNVDSHPEQYIRRLFDEGSDKENLTDGRSNRADRPGMHLSSPSKKLLAEKNGDAVLGAGTRGLDSSIVDNVKSEPIKAAVCTGDALSCPIHGTNRTAISWSFYKDESDLNALVDSLNQYGVRESELRKALLKNKQRILDSFKRCPLSKLNPTLPDLEIEQLENKKSSKTGSKYLNPHLDFPPDTPIHEILSSNLRIMILETEEKVDAGHIGKLKVKDRAAWRDALLAKTYDKQCGELFWGSDKERNLEETHSEESSDIKSEGSRDVIDRSQSPNATDNCVERLMRTDVLLPKKEVSDLASAILQIEQAIEHRFLKKPFGIADCKEKDKEKAKQDGYKLRERWEESLMASASISQLFVHIYSLDNHIAWSRSALKASCRICRRSSDPESMLLCDMCNKGHHLYCLKPPLKKVPEGDWFCPSCSPKTSPVKRSKKVKMDLEESDSSERQSSSEECKVVGRCKACKSKGDLVLCDVCGYGLHLECVNPPLKKYPRSKWTCSGCRRVSASKKDELSPGEAERASRRRCAKAATAKISHFAKQLRTTVSDESGSMSTEEDDGEREREVDGSRRRSRRSLETGEANGSFAVGRSDLPLDNAALQEMLDVLMHHKDAWPFLRPVTKAEVPDYRNIIKTPMDFGTIKHKLNMLQYRKNSQVIADALLVFENCYTYNQSESEVYKAGERLQKLFEKLCSERKMNIDVDYDVRPPSLKKAKLSI